MKTCVYCKKQTSWIYGITFVTERKIFNFCSKKCKRYFSRKKNSYEVNL